MRGADSTQPSSNLIYARGQGDYLMKVGFRPGFFYSDDGQARLASTTVVVDGELHVLLSLG